MSNDENSHFAKFLFAGAVGALAGSWWKSNQIDEGKKSRVEREDSDFTDEVRTEINELLDDLELLEDMDDEDDFRDTIADYLKKHSEYEIEVTPNTQFGKPDILIAGTLALETKYNPSKVESDRCIGQCANYSREWATWIVLYDTSESRIQYLHDVLQDKGLDNIPIISFK
ncbi:hypothetical protein JNM05_16035 [bacterium]|nr:hypothetical protein [bacterium]